MSNYATQAIGAPRNDKMCAIPIAIVGVDLSATPVRAQIRLTDDNPVLLLDLQLTGDAAATGIRLVNVAQDAAGIYTSHLLFQVTKADMQALPYAGEVGDPWVGAYGLQVDGITRLRGPFVVLASALDSDSAPANRPSGSTSSYGGGLPASVTMAIGDAGVTVSIDGLDLLGPLASRSEAAATRAEAAASAIGDVNGGHTDAVRAALALSRPGRSLVDYSQAATNATLNQANGEVVLGGSDFDVTALFPIEPNTQYTMNDSFVLGFYDRNQNFLRARNVAATFVSQADECWSRAQVYRAFRNTFVIGVGALVPVRSFFDVAPLSGQGLAVIGNSQVENGLFQPELVRCTGMPLVLNSGNPGRDIGYLADVVIPNIRNSAGKLGGARAVVFVEGHNEWAGAARPLGFLTDTPDADTTYGKMRLAILSLLSIDPNVAIVVCGPTYRGQWTDGSTGRVYPPDSGTPGGGAIDPTINGRATGDLINTAMREVAYAYGQPFCDLRAESGISSYTVSTLTSDGLHWGAGAPRIGRLIAAAVNRAS